MKAFHTIAVPHNDIITKKLTMDVFAADLWDTFQNRGSDEYTDHKIFFKKTHMTTNLKSILNGVQNRLEGKGGDGFQHIETPFGGGKTHALIAMYHYSKQWGAKPVVIVGTAMSPDDTVWGMIEKQLCGKIDKLSGNLAPGREKLREVLSMHKSVLILIDELLPYVSVAAGVKISDTTLATQTITFIQQLSEVISTLDRVCVVASFPASVIEMADKQTADELLQKIRKVSSRKERKITPIDPNDVPNIIRARLFSTLEKNIEEGAEKIISNFVDYCDRESILPSDKTVKQYRDEFRQTYPFLPQIIDVLYHNWGTFPSFQRTRGVLRLLSLLIYSLKDSEKSYITLSDFDLENDEIRRELLEHIGNPIDSVVTKDITDSDSGAKRTDQDISSTYKGLHLGTRAATAIFMCSFSNSGTNGATMNQIKRAASNPEILSSVVGDIVGNFKSKLSYIKNEDERYLFSSEPNLNRLKIDKMDNISDKEIQENEKSLLEANVGKQKIRVKIWPNHPKDVEDSPTLKLVILFEDNTEFCNKILDNKGDTPRIYRNSIFFLCPSEAERIQFIDTLKSKIALEKISSEYKNLNTNQKKYIEDELKKETASLEYQIKKYYRILYIPNINELDKFDMGIPTTGVTIGISDQVFERLILEQEIHEKIGPLVLKNEYLNDQKFANTSSMYKSMLSIKGNRRPVNNSVILSSLEQGVSNGVFGLGELVNSNPICKYFKNQPLIAFTDNEVIIHDSVCSEQIDSEVSSQQSNMKSEVQDIVESKSTRPYSETKFHSLNFGIEIPEGGMNDVLGILRLINEKFNTIYFKINAENGTVTNIDLRKIEEALKQMGIRYDLKLE